MGRRAKLSYTDEELLRMLPPRNSFGATDLMCLDRYAPGRDLSQVYRQSLWNDDFCHRPSWCDARLALKQIRKGRAKGNVPALWIRSLLQRALFSLGCTIQRRASEVLVGGVVILCLFSIGLKNTSFETDMDHLWVETCSSLTDLLSRLAGTPACNSGATSWESQSNTKGGRLEAERAAYEEIINKPKSSSREERDADSPNLKPGSSVSYVILIQTPRKRGLDILTTEDLLLHVGVVNNATLLEVEGYGEKWSLTDLCYKPAAPSFEISIGMDIKDMLDKMIPCVIISPLDCFWEGSKALGPSPPLQFGSTESFFVPSLKSELSWKNLNPKELFGDISNLGLFDDSYVTNLLDRSGVGEGYQRKYCLNPLDPECPKTAPNYVDVCQLVEKFVAWNKLSRRFNISEVTVPTPTTPAPGNETDYDDTENILDTLFGNHNPADDVSPQCKALGDDVRKFVSSDRTLWKRFVSSNDEWIADQMSGGCHAFAENFMQWPEELIVGGIEKESSKIVKAEALQTLFLLAGPQEIYERFKHNVGGKERLSYDWSPTAAAAVINAWQRNFTEYIYHHKNNTTPGSDRMVHPLAMTSINDMLQEFSRFNPTVVILGYVIMVVYASVSLLSCRDHGVKSCVGLAIAGCLLVTFSSAAGLGCTMMMNIKFNPATTQIVPFLTLGLGVDDMFLLVHNYVDIIQQANTNEIGLLLKETGLSAFLTSINNILAFLAGGILPVPAIRDFCLQVAVLLMFNAVTIVTVYPAMMSIDLVRRKHKLVDVFCCIRVDQDKVQPKEINGVSNNDGPPPSYEAAVNTPTTPTSVKHKFGKSCGLQKYSLHVLIRNYYEPLLCRNSVKVAVILFHLLLFGAGVIGITRISIGLELTDLIPQDTAPYAFLSARERYFSFYPFYIVLEDPVDYATQQITIREFRNAIGKIDYVMKNDGKVSENFWLDLFEQWLNRVQTKFDEDFRRGFINQSGVISSQVSSDAKLGYKLLCNKGREVNCSRVGNTRLIDKDGIINPDGFYNYLTAWVHTDSMTYHFSQADFYPFPPDWQNSDHIKTDADNRIPPAELLLTRIPFFANNLVDTPLVVDMIRQVRAVCDEYAARGIRSMPDGVTFTFWEHYLHLPRHLLTALAMIVSAVFIIISLLLFSPWTSIIVVLILFLMVTELGGFLGIYGLKMNPVSAVTLITAVGIGVEFTVHMSLSFLTNLGTRNERMKATLDHMFIPVLHGGLSTLLGVIMLAFSEFGFIVSYFFCVLSTLIVLGILNGLLLLPVLLSLVGPRSEVRSVDGSDRIPPPTPPPVARTASTFDKLHGSNLGGIHKSQRGYRRQSDASLQSDLALSTIVEESTPPSSTTPPVVTLTPVQVVVHATGGKNSKCLPIDSPVTVTTETKVHVQCGASDDGSESASIHTSTKVHPCNNADGCRRSSFDASHLQGQTKPKATPSSHSSRARRRHSSSPLPGGSPSDTTDERYSKKKAAAKNRTKPYLNGMNSS